jgi:hypothetical protein
LTFNDTGYVLSEMLGISVAEFERKAKGMAKLNLVQLSAARIPNKKPINMRLSAIPSFSTIPESAWSQQNAGQKIYLTIGSHNI